MSTNAKASFGYCDDCGFWDVFGDEAPGVGICRRFAPRPQTGNARKTDGEENVIWPITRGNEGCGDFGVKPKKSANRPANGLLKIEQVCEVLGISKRSAARLVASGDLKTVKIGKSLRFKSEAVDFFIEAREDARRASGRKRVRTHRERGKFEAMVGAALRLGSEEKGEGK